MMKHSYLNRLLSLLLAVVLVFGLCGTALAAGARDSESLTYEKLEQDQVSAQLLHPEEKIEEAEASYADTDLVRVMIVLEEPAAVSLMCESDELTAQSSAVASYRQELERQQALVAEAVSEEVLDDGETLDVVWNLTLAANAISANVEYGKLKDIAALNGVSAVYVETRYEPMTEASTDNIVAQTMTGASSVQQNSGYTGAGSRIAVIDTGTDTDHQSFSEAGYEYALSIQAENRGLSYAEYVDSLNLLTEEEIGQVLTSLNACKRYSGLTAADLYGSAKLPFNFNYVDGDLDVTHDNDNQGSHGSHVAGIAAANAYVNAEAMFDFNGDGQLNQDDAQALMDYVVLGTAISNPFYADLSGNGAVTSYDVYLLLNQLGNSGDQTFTSAAASVGVTGVAPDAQIITMKVFGKDGGAYSSDYMAALEDAIVLGCDAANLSLGAATSGFTTAHEETDEETNYINALMESLTESGIIMCVATGNDGNWAVQDDAYGLMYADEAGTFTISDPATYENTLSVASVDNVGSVSTYSVLFAAQDGSNGVRLTLDAVGDGMDQPWNSLDETSAGTTYEAVFLGDPTNLLTGETQTDLTIYGGDGAFEGLDLTGKIVFVARGNSVYFSDKHANAAAAGAAAVVIYNNEPGSISASIEGSEATVPCATVSLEDALTFFRLCETKNGLYTGSVTVTSKLAVDYGEDAAYLTMSDFSSWGTTGDLTIKPEITAPGGAIYSVNGMDPSGAGYEIMSGTSMSTPHVAGLTALMAQYIREADLEARTGQTARVLTQSLLMSTAVPVTEESTGLEYSVRNQGAGLADVEAAVRAESYILMGADATVSYADGKVKAELGDGTGPWTFSFTIHNLEDRSLTYTLDASILTTGTVTADGHALSTDEMAALDANVSFSGGSTVTVPANGVATVTVSVEIPASTAAGMAALGYENGFYVEGYVYVRPLTSLDGVTGVTHSIPLLGWYGSWDDPSMYDSGSYLDYAYGTLERPSHLDDSLKNLLAWTPAGLEDPYVYTGNVFNGLDGDSRYIEARNAFNSTEDALWEIYAIFPTLIRNAADIRIQVTDTDTGAVLFTDDFEDLDDALYACFYIPQSAQWTDTTLYYGIDLEGWDLSGLTDGQNVTVTLSCVPDYYVENGTVDWDSVDGKGTDLSFRFTVDNTAPELNEMTLDGSTLTVDAQDNNYIAAVILLDGAATTAVEYAYPDMDEDQRGKEASVSFDMSAYASQYGGKAVVAVCDYAGNQSYYALNLNGEGQSYGDLVAFQYDAMGDANKWVSFDVNVNQNETGLFTSGINFVCAEYVNGYVFAQAENGDLYGIPYADMLANSVNLEQTYIAHLSNVYQDFAYSYKEGKLYGLCTYLDEDGYPTSEINSINLNGAYYDEDNWTDVAAYQEDWATQRGGVYGLTLACDDEGSLYILGPSYDWDTEELGDTAQLWKATLDIEEYFWGTVISFSPFLSVGDTGLEMDYLQSMTWDHNTETLYWARFYAESWYSLKAELLTVDPETAECETAGTLSGETAALFAPLTEESASKEEHANVPEMDPDTVATPIVSPDVVTMNKGSTYQLTYDLDPWYTTHKNVVWSSDDESVATVDQKGLVTAVSDGSCTITVAAKDDESLFTTCSVSVASLDLTIEGVVTAQTAGIGQTTGVSTYKYEMVEGDPTFGTVASIHEEDVETYGLSLASSAYGRGSIWASEYGNTGMVYEIDPDTGAVVQMLQPVDGEMMFGLSYSEKLDKFTGIMNMYLFVDLSMTEQDAEDAMAQAEAEDTYEFNWHRLNLLEYLQASDESFLTGENGNGASSDVVICGVTYMDNVDSTSYEGFTDFLGGYDADYCYTPETTLILLDNVGRLWYVDEITGMSLEEGMWSSQYYRGEPDDWGYYSEYVDANGYGVMAVENKDGTYNVFNIREIAETPLTDMYRKGTMPRITYHFSDIHYAGKTEDGAPILFLSLYDYWNNGTTNQLYLYIPGVGTGEFYWDENWNRVEVKTPDQFFDIGDTGEHNIIATIHKAELTGGLASTEAEPFSPLAVSYYKGQKQ